MKILNKSGEEILYDSLKILENVTIINESEHAKQIKCKGCLHTVETENSHRRVCKQSSFRQNLKKIQKYNPRSKILSALRSMTRSFSVNKAATSHPRQIHALPGRVAVNNYSFTQEPPLKTHKEPPSG